MAPEIGDTAPDFTLADQAGNPVSLSGLRGRNVVLYFYPKADTPGCTTQACGVRDHRTDYEQAGAVVGRTVARSARRPPRLGRPLEPAGPERARSTRCEGESL